jgi:hypothetical protein
MTWLYVPNATSSPSAPASEGSSSESCSLSTISERLAAGSATWRGKSQPPRAWWRRWKQGGFIRLLSGLTCSPSTLDRGVASFISSLRETPARTTALPESVPEPLAQGSSPPRSAASPQSAGLILSSERTCRGTRTDNSKPSSRHWSDWATALRQEYSARPKPEIPCGASDCSSWPSAKVATGAYSYAGGDKNKPVLNLEGAALEWKAPVADDTGTRTKRYEQGGMALSMQADQWIAPMASDDGQKVTAVAHQKMLCNQVLAFHPPSSPDQPIAGGSMSSTDGPSSNQPSAKRKLNPIFVEALMRWPTGLSGFERQEMAWTRWWLLMPSFVSALVSQKPQGQGELF